MKQSNREKSLIFILKISAFAFFTTIISAYISSLSLISSEEFNLVTFGISLTILAVPFHVKGKENHKLYFLSIFMNAIGSGFFIHQVSYQPCRLSLKP